MKTLTQFISSKQVQNNYFDLLPPKAIEHFETRTREHIERVINNANTIYNGTQNIFQISPSFLSDVQNHDKSKFYSELYPGYVWIDNYYNLKQDYPNDEIKTMAESACKLHYRYSRHHPEYHLNPNDMIINDLCEMVADWEAMSQEYNSKTYDFYRNKALPKYKFNTKNQSIIERLIRVFE